MRTPLICLLLVLQLSRAAAAEEAAVPSFLEGCKFGETVDILKSNRYVNSLRGYLWSRKNGVLRSDPRVIRSLNTLHTLPERYVIRATVRREKGSGMLAFGLRMGIGSTVLQLDAAGGKYSGLQIVKGIGLGNKKNESRVNGKLIRDKEPAELLIAVLKNEIIVTIDGKESVRWKGSPLQLSVDYNALSMPHDVAAYRQLHIYSQKTTWRISRLEVTPLLSVPGETMPAEVPLEASRKAQIDRIVHNSSLHQNWIIPEPNTLYLVQSLSLAQREIARKGGLYRELCRQALLLAAREELGLSTRDWILRESFPSCELSEVTDDTFLAHPLNLISTNNDRGEVQVTIIREGINDQYHTLWDGEAAFSPELPYGELTAWVEQKSREDFPRFLSKLYVNAPGNSQWKEQNPVPPEINRQFHRWNAVSQIIGIRNLHRAIRDSGESPERLAALSQAYARLGLMTSNYFSTHTKVYFARALLYAERMTVKTDRTADAYWNRAYVRALIGLPVEAQADIAKAAARGGAENSPAWSEDLRLFCSGESAALRERLEGPESGPLTAFLYWKLQYQRTSEQIRHDAYLRLADKESESLHALFLTARFTNSLGAKAVANQTAELLPQLVSRYLPELSGLPRDIQDLLNQSDELTLGDLARIVSSLKQADANDRKEPSLSLVSRLIEDALFLTSWQVLNYRQRWLSVPVSDQADELAELFDDHPGRYILRAFGKSQSERQKLTRAAEKMCATERYNQSSVDQLPESPRALRRQRDWIDMDLVMNCLDAKLPSHQLRWLGELDCVAPRHPITMEFHLKFADQLPAEKLLAWEQTYRQSISIQKMLASYYSRHGRMDEAQRCLNRWIDFAPSFESYQELAKLAELRDDNDAWLQAMTTSLEYHVPGLEHARVNEKIARYYLEGREPETALPYAKAAAGSGSQWGFRVAAEVEEALGNYEQADEYHRRNWNRYNVGMDWFAFRLRTGFGDYKEVGREWIGKHGDVERFSSPRFGTFFHIYLHHLMGDEDRAYQQLVEVTRTAKFDPYFAWHLFSRAVVQSDDAIRDEMLRLLSSKRLRAESTASLCGSYRIAGHIQQKIAEDRPGDLDLEWIDGEILSLRDKSAITMWYVLGTYLAKFGREADALRYLRLAANVEHSVAITSLDCTLAQYILREFGDRELSPREFTHVPLATPRNASGAAILPHTAPVKLARFRGSTDSIVTIDERQTFRLWQDIKLAATRDFSAEGIEPWVSKEGEDLQLLRRQERSFELRPLAKWDVKGQTFHCRPAVPILGRLGRSPSDLFLTLSSQAELSESPYFFYIVHAWNRSNGKLLWTYELAGNILYAIQPSDDGRQVWMLIRKHDDRSTKLIRLDARTGEALKTTELTGHPVSLARLNPARNAVVTQARDGEIRVWQLPEWTHEISLRRPEASALALSPDRSLLVIGYPGGELEICDLKHRQVLVKFQDHPRRITSLHFSRDGQSLCSSSEDFTVRLWKTADLRDWASRQPDTKAPLEQVVQNSLGMTLAPIPAGDFFMGERKWFATGTQGGRRDHLEYKEQIHRVRISRPFYLAQTEVTVGQFRRFVEATGYQTAVERGKTEGSFINVETSSWEPSPNWTWKTPPFDQDDNHPVCFVTWNDAVAFCEWLSEKEGRTYRLPTEAEWEHACRAGTDTVWFTGNTNVSLAGYANLADKIYVEEFGKSPYLNALPEDGYIYTAPVGSFLANPYGLYDMSGNVAEWCQDYLNEKEYFGKQEYDDESPVVDPVSHPPPDTSYVKRVVRGGDYSSPPIQARSAFKDSVAHGERKAYSDVGFRVLLEIDEDPAER